MPDPKGEWSLKENNSELYHGKRSKVDHFIEFAGRQIQIATSTPSLIWVICIIYFLSTSSCLFFFFFFFFFLNYDTIYQQESNNVSDLNPLNTVELVLRKYIIQITHINEGVDVAICICRPANSMARVKNVCHSHALVQLPCTWHNFIT